MEIETELGIPLQELAIELIPVKKNQKQIIDLLDHQAKKAEDSVKQMVFNYTKKAKANVTVTKVEFTEMDSANLNHGAAYFIVTLKGNIKELKKIAGDDSLFVYNWKSPSIEGISKKSKHNLTLRNNVSMLDGNNKKVMKKADSIEKIGKELLVKFEQHSFGELAVLKHRKDWHAILQPEHLEKIRTLKKGESCNIDDEQGYKWLITNNGDGYNIKSKFGNNNGHFKLNNKSFLHDADWTEPAHLEKRDHLALKEIQRLYNAKKYKEAMNYATCLDTIVREEVPGDIWKKLGGRLTKTGEEKLRVQKNSQPIQKAEAVVKKKHIVFNYGVRLLKELYERYLERELIDSDYIKILEIAENNNDEFVDLVSASHVNLMKFLDSMNKALKEFDTKQ